MNRKNRPVCRFLIVLLFTVLLPVLSFAADGKVTISGVFYQGDARSMQNMLNDFRAGKEGAVDLPDDYNSWGISLSAGENWQRTQSGGVEIIKGLKEPLEYDYTLEQVAMLRAVETAVYWDHDRPDSTLGNCFSVYPSSYRNRGENLAVGRNTFSSAKSVFNAWKETNDGYSGQGHRRVMLGKNFTAVGIAHFKYNGWDFWVQEFGSPTLNTTSTAALNGPGHAEVSFTTDRVVPVALSFGGSSGAVRVACGEKYSLSAAQVMLQAASGTEGFIASGYYSVGTASLSWRIADPSVAELSGNAIIGKRPGTTTLETTFAGIALSCPVEVEKGDISGASVTGAKVAAFTGSKVRPEVKVTLNGSTLREGTDYSLSYRNNSKTGKGTVTVTGKGSYEGSVSKTFEIRLPEGFSYKDKASKAKTTRAYYKVTKVTSATKAEVILVRPVSKNVTSFTIPASIKISGTTCKVTAVAADAFRDMKKLKKVVIGKNVASIGENAFRDDSKLADIQIKTKLLTSGKMGSDAFKGIYRKAQFRLPSAKKSAYKKLLLKKGAKKTMTFR